MLAALCVKLLAALAAMLGMFIPHHTTFGDIPTLGTLATSTISCGVAVKDPLYDTPPNGYIFGPGYFDADTGYMFPEYNKGLATSSLKAAHRIGMGAWKFCTDKNGFQHIVLISTSSTATVPEYDDYGKFNTAVPSADVLATTTP